MSVEELPKIADVEKESKYGYVFGVSGPGEPPAVLHVWVCRCISTQWPVSSHLCPELSLPES